MATSGKLSVRSTFKRSPIQSRTNLPFLLHGSTSLDIKQVMNAATQSVILDASSIDNLPDEQFARSEAEPGVRWKTLLCSSKTPTDTFTCGIAVCPPKTGELLLHRHQPAELYHFIQGTGEVEINGVTHPARQGSVIFIPGNAAHGVKNLSQTEDLKWLYVFAVDSFGQVCYDWQKDSAQVTDSVHPIELRQDVNVS
ncbi:hypothetical protein CERZMDRAFT_102501 [Cercospora zeae-maydis SCOH1-5]|uniref:Cupin type-2 domain-containing protein n=1 Tax=Cercospora zeae-maydis SCOH1-5 TaxID=717836 RepID=A0A6A6F2G6_9PEZI|nr:hypothetical protein CERZMDRAFT_102501 [Cercospora zeae-maydis SCOH1-5]